MIIRYNPALKGRARELRKQGVLSEVILWEHLKGKKVFGLQFSRQKPIGNFIVDFYCSKMKLVIEIDGTSHDGRFDYDMERQRILEAMGLTVLRFNDSDVKKEVNSVLAAIRQWIENNPLTPFSKGELKEKKENNAIFGR
jgi:very-short-patch-repair endonuclease